MNARGLPADNWFSRLTGFQESDYKATRSRLRVADRLLQSAANGHSYATGGLEILSLGELRERVEAVRGAISGQLKVSTLLGEARALHSAEAYAGALFQVASQFNLLEMAAPDVTPEHGVARYESDRTQGPACAIACGAATIYRNYFVPMGGAHGQTRERQIDCLHDLGRALGNEGEALWRMQNGYALGQPSGMDLVRRRLEAANDGERDALRALLRVGVQWDAQVTDLDEHRLVSQVFCSALPVAYMKVQAERCEPLARLVLEATYEATLCAAVLNVARGASNTVLLTRVGGGVFGNDARWIDAAIERALGLAENSGLDVRFVQYGAGQPLR
jgi:hypothetical protein